MKDIMVDIETLGTKPGCVTLSIGAVLFNPYSFDLGQQFYLNINVEDSQNAVFIKSRINVIAVREALMKNRSSTVIAWNVGRQHNQLKRLLSQNSASVVQLLRK